jgi:hypothetical protein
LTDHVELTLPARPELLVLARMTIGALAAHADMGVDDVEDLRLAVDELCLSAAGDSPGGRLELRYDWDGSGMEVSCTFRAADPGERSDSEEDVPALGVLGSLPNDLSERILDALVDEHGHEDLDGGKRAWFKKRLERTPR